MAITCDILQNSYLQESLQAHVVITAFQELTKNTLSVSTAVFRSKAEYLAKMPPLEFQRFTPEVTELEPVTDIRAALYVWLMQQEYFSNAVADLNNDFPVPESI